jgi:hypothetical protein
MQSYRLPCLALSLHLFVSPRPAHCRPMPARLYKVDTIIEDALVLSCEGKVLPRLSLTLKPALKAAAAAAALPSSLGALQIGQRLPAYVRSVSDHGLFISMVHGLSGLARRKHIIAGRDLSATYTKGQTVFVEVEKVGSRRTWFLCAGCSCRLFPSPCFPHSCSAH